MAGEFDLNMLRVGRETFESGKKKLQIQKYRIHVDAAFAVPSYQVPVASQLINTLLIKLLLLSKLTKGVRRLVHTGQGRVVESPIKLTKDQGEF